MENRSTTDRAVFITKKDGYDISNLTKVFISVAVMKKLREREIKYAEVFGNGVIARAEEVLTIPNIKLRQNPMLGDVIEAYVK